jgi:UDP-perosamine 4-acetyltransferase
LKKPFIVIGSGGHAKVVLDLLLERGEQVICLADIDKNKTGSFILGVEVMEEVDVLDKYKPDTVNLALGIGVSSSNLIDGLSERCCIAEKFEKLGYCFPSITHPKAIISRDCILEEGAQIMAGSVIQPGCHIGKYVVVNTNSSIDHDCVIGEGCHIAPASCLSGTVIIQVFAYIGAGSTVNNNISIGSRSIVGSGSVVVDDIDVDTCVVGIPAKVRK